MFKTSICSIFLIAVNAEIAVSQDLGALSTGNYFGMNNMYNMNRMMHPNNIWNPNNGLSPLSSDLPFEDPEETYDLSPYMGVEGRNTLGSFFDTHIALLAMTNPYFSSEGLISLGFSEEASETIPLCREQVSSALDFLEATNALLLCMDNRQEQGVVLPPQAEVQEEESRQRIVKGGICHELVNGAVSNGARIQVDESNYSEYDNDLAYTCFLRFK